MKKIAQWIFVSCLAVIAAGLFVFSAEAKPRTSTEPSVYYDYGFPHLVGTEPTVIKDFTIQSNGVVELQADGTFVPTVPGWLLVSANCDIKDGTKSQYGAEFHLRIAKWSVDNGTAFVIPAEPFIVEGWQEGVEVARVACSIGIQAFK